MGTRYWEAAVPFSLQQRSNPQLAPSVLTGPGSVRWLTYSVGLKSYADMTGRRYVCMLYKARVQLFVSKEQPPCQHKTY